MPGITSYNAGSGQGTEGLKTLFDAEVGLNPTEETKIADWVSEPFGVQKFGTQLKLRKNGDLTITEEGQKTLIAHYDRTTGFLEFTTRKNSVEYYNAAVTCI